MIHTVGEALLDVFIRPGGQAWHMPGGSMFNTAISLGRAGEEVSFAGIAGDDHQGSYIATFLTENGAGSTHLRLIPGFRTPLALAWIDEKGEASYTFYRDEFPFQELILPDTKPGDIVLFGSFFSLHDGIHERINSWVRKCRSNDVFAIYDPNYRLPHKSELNRLIDRIVSNVSNADIVKGSDADFNMIFGAKSGEEAWEYIRSFGCRALVYTRGAQGVSWYSAEHQMHLPALEVNVVSTVGAGDAFSAGMIAYLAHRRDKTEALKDERFIHGMLSEGLKFAAHVCGSDSNY